MARAKADYLICIGRNCVAGSEELIIKISNDEIEIYNEDRSILVSIGIKKKVIE